ncbi:MAG: hypothetical protein HQL56_06360 [Magnetococcales bacterium]|nr:hypothetical protein [Magnetococcales bacterium]
MARRGWIPLRLAGWLAFFGVLLFQGAHVNYLASLQSHFLEAGALLLALLFLVPPLPRATASTAKTWIPEGLITLVHWLPLFLFVMAGKTALNANNAVLNNSYARMQVPQAPAARPDPSTLKPGQFLPITLLDLYVNENLKGVVPVEVEGRLHRLSAEDLERHADSSTPVQPTWVLYRHVMSCCAADASLISFKVEKWQPEGKSSYDWVRMKGWTIPMEAAPVAGKPGLDNLRKLEVVSVEPIPVPKEPYLNWLSVLP